MTSARVYVRTAMLLEAFPVVDTHTYKISILEKEGKKLLHLDQEEKKTTEFQSSCGVALDSDDCIFVVEGGNHRIQKFTRSGIFVTNCMLVTQTITESLYLTITWSSNTTESLVVSTQ